MPAFAKSALNRRLLSPRTTDGPGGRHLKWILSLRAWLRSRLRPPPRGYVTAASCSTSVSGIASIPAAMVYRTLPG
jgi:hypothetical protein